MAYASVASLLQTIDLVNYHNNSSISISRFNDQIKSLHEHSSFLQSFLEDDDPNRAKNWEETIREVADRAEEIIDLLVSDSLLKSIESGLDGGVDELEKVREEMESTADRVKGRRIKAKAEPDQELTEIVSRLREGSRNLEIIAIVGLGSPGMSTLARNACNHPLVMEHFDVRAWSTLSFESSGQGIILDLLRNINIESVSDSGYEEAMESLHRSLYGRRYLIVLQDVWTVRSWDEVRRALPDNGNGSRIILTTRLIWLANHAGHVHRMDFLSEDQSWNLLREKIFEGEPCPPKLEHYGKIISNNCRGLRLIIEVVSGILAADQTEFAWEDVLENIKIVSQGRENVLTHVLSLSYTYLPHHLRPCLLYLGCFPEDCEIRVSKLIKMWVAEGYLNQSESKSFQEMGEEHVENLAHRSLVWVSKRKSNGRIKSITVHGIVRDMCRRQGQMGNFIYDVARFEQQSMGLKLQPVRLVSLSNHSHDFLRGGYASTIRTVILHSMSYGKVRVRLSMGNVRLLRILDLSNAQDYDLPGEVFQLFHLRYLAFIPGFSISKAISNLQNLQTLIICPRENGRKLVKLPGGIWRMLQLRHICNFSFKLPALKQGEAETSALENLETLSRVVDFVCSRKNLKMIPNVKKMNIYYTDSFKDVVELHNLISLHKLEILKIEIERSSVEQHKMSFEFPLMLKKLNLCGLQLPWEDMKIVASLPNLEVLKLRNGACFGDSWETSERGFSRLTYLMFEECDPEDWITESSHFPKLKTLVLRSCLHLSKVPCEIGEIPTLQLIELDGQNRSLLRSAQQIQEDRRQSLGDDQFQILVLGLRNTIIDDDDEDDDDDDQM